MTDDRRLRGKRILLGVCGSIAAYKAVNLVRLFVQHGATVTVAMTKAATQFVTPLTFEVVSKRSVTLDLFSGHDDMPHLSLPEENDMIVLAPCTANRLATAALGLADDLVSTMLLTTQRPVVLAPAMDGEMWTHPAVRGHVRTLRERGVTVLEPEHGELASGKCAQGRFPDEDTILSAVARVFSVERDFTGQRLLISAGPTREPIDAVRFLSNGSSGKMGYALARAAHARGAQVTLVSGPTSLHPPDGVECVNVCTAEEMYQALDVRFPEATALVMTAAVSDFRPCDVHAEKMKKHDWTGEPLSLERTTDILAALSARRTNQLLVGFAAETQDLIQHAQEKLRAKRLDMVVVNQVGGPDSAFGSDMNEVVVLTRTGGATSLPRQSKDRLAHRLLDAMRACHAKTAASPA